MSRPLTDAGALSAARGLASNFAPRLAREAVYRAVWRWHFYAGLLCLPFLILLSATGAVYLFKAEIDATVFAARTVVAPNGRSPLGPDRLIFEAREAVSDASPVSYLDPPAPTASAVVTMAGASGRTLVYLDPYDGTVLDAVARDGEFSRVVRSLHSLAYFGPVANGAIEVVAGFTLILVVTGVYLWWPRGRTGGVVTVRGGPARRVWWRDVHALTGLVAGAGLFFLAATGLPWSILWGHEFRALADAAGLGQPPALAAARPVAPVPMRDRLEGVGWALEETPMPEYASGPAAPLGIDRAAAILRDLGMPAGYELSLPRTPTDVYAATAYPRDVTRQRMIALDPQSGRTLADVRFADLGAVARFVQYGIGIHKGEHWGRANQLAMLAVCLATILLSVTAAVMWWKRRPAGRLGVPPWPRERRAAATVTGLVLGLGALFPLTGLAILAMLGLDLAVLSLRRRPAA